MKTWNDLHTPKIEELLPQLAIKEIINAIKRKTPCILIHGPIGIGKTTAIHAIDKSLDLEILEMNASDFRNKDAIEKTLGSFSQQLSLFAKEKIIIVDEVDCFLGNNDRGGTQALLSVIKNSKFPCILIANDIEEKKIKELKKFSLVIEYPKPTPEEIYKVLENICKKENKKFSDLSLKSLSRRVDGDLRAAINDLQVYTTLKEELDITNIEDRNPESSINAALTMIFKTKSSNFSLRALDNLSVDLDECLSWIEENIQHEYKKPEELVKAYNALSRADIFRSRIRKRQHWRFLVYQSNLMTAGVSLARDEKKPSAAKYKRSMVGLLIWQANMKFSKRKAIAEKLAPLVHTSSKQIIKDFPIYKEILKNPEIQYQLELPEEQIDWLNTH